MTPLRFAAALACGFASSAGAAELPDAVRQAGVPHASINAIYAPMEYKDAASGQLTGLDVELGAALAKRLGLKVEWSESAFEQLIPSLKTGRADLLISGLTDTAARRELISFVDYLSSGSQFVVRAADAGAYPTEASLCGRKVAGSRSTNLPEQIADWSKAHCEASGKAAVAFLGADNNIDARSQLEQGRADAMVQDSLTVPYVAAQEPGTYAAVGQPFEVLVMGIGVTKADKDLQDQLRAAVQGTIADGTYAALLKKWNLPASSGLAEATVDGGR